MSKSNLGRLICAAAALIWGLSFVVMKDALDCFPVFTLLALRFTGGFLAVGLIFRKRMRRLPARTWRHGIVVGVFLAGGYITQTFGLRYTTPGKNAFLTAVYCVLVPFVDWIWSRRRPSGQKILAGVLCLAGVGLISLNESLTMGRGEALTLLSGVLYAFQVDTIARFAKEDDPVALTVIQFLVTAVICGGMALAAESWPAVIGPQVWGQLAFLILMATAGALLMQNVGQSMTTAASAAIMLSLESVFGALTSVILGRETLALRTMAGFLLVFGAVLMSVLERESGRRKEPDHG